MRIIANLSELESLVGQEIGVSDFIPIDQPRIDAFAAATNDRQWIHIDAERAARESPYRSTIAHGFLTLALLPHFFSQAIRIDGVRMVVNYGINRVRFPAPVRVGSNLRARFRLAAANPFSEGVQVEWHVTFECEGLAKPVCIASALMRGYR